MQKVIVLPLTEKQILSSWYKGTITAGLALEINE